MAYLTPRAKDGTYTCFKSRFKIYPAKYESCSWMIKDNSTGRYYSAGNLLEVQDICSRVKQKGEQADGR